MNRFVKTALAIAAAGSVANAGVGDSEWSVLDSEISGLASSLKPSMDGMGWSVLLRAVYSHSSDDIATGGGANHDLSGFNFNDVDVAFWGNHGPYTFRLSADIDDNEAGIATGNTSLVLEDAYVRWPCGDYFDVQMGNMKPRVSGSNSFDPEKMLFIDRSAFGSSFDFWDNGVGVMGMMEQIAWYAYVLNGVNGHSSDHIYVLRGEFKLGSGAGEYEGAMGSSDQVNGTLGLTFLNDDSAPTVGNNSDMYAWLLDFHGNASNIGFGAEFIMLGDDLNGLATDEDFNNIFAAPLQFQGDSNPFSIYGSYLISPEWEVGVRYEDLDNGSNGGPDNSIISVAANYYRPGNGGKWQAQYSMFDADSAFPDGDVFEVGYSIGATR
jgi:hypothetical protein